MKIQQRVKLGKRIKDDCFIWCKRLFLMCMVIFLAFPITVSAGSGEETDEETRFDLDSHGFTRPYESSGWINHDSREYKNIYGDNAQVGGDGQVNLHDDMGEETGFLSSLLGEMIGGLADLVYNLFEGGNVDLTIDGIVYGRVKGTRTLTRGDNGAYVNMQMNLSQFGLEPNNAWGIFGASLYYILRNRFAMIVIPVVALVMIGKEAFRGGEKGRAGIKAVLKKLVGFFVIMYAVPYLVEAYIYIRDVAMVVARDSLVMALEDTTGEWYGTGSIYGLIKTSWENLNYPLLLGLVMFGYACAGLVYFWDYIRIALLIAATFGLFPVVLIWWFFKPKIVTDWLNLIMPALLTPFVDMILLLTPCFVMSMFNRAFATTGNVGTSLVLAMTVLACMWTMRAVRERILKLFGFEGVRGGAGGLGLALMMLARGGIGGRRENIGNLDGGKAPSGNLEVEASRGAEDMRAAGEVMNNADKTVQDINSSDYDMFSSEEGSNADRLMQDMEGEGPSYVTEEAGRYETEVNDGENLAEEMNSENIELENTEASVPNAGENVESVLDGVEGAQEAVRDAGSAMETAMESAQNAVRGGTETTNIADNRNKESVAEGVNGSGMDEVPGAADKATTFASDREPLRFAPMSEDQEKFVKTKLPERDQKRLDNLRHIDALEDGIARNESIIAKSGYSRGAYEAAQTKGAELSRRMDNLKMEQQQIDARSKALEKDKASLSTEEYSRRYDSITNDANRNERAVKEVESAQMANSAYMDSMKTSYQADRANVAYKQELEARKGVESQYAYNSGLGSMSNRTYSNANDFVRQKQIDQIKKDHVNYSNFDTRQYDGILTPAEREQLYRERSERIAAERADDIIIRAAAKTIGVTTGAVLAGAASFAGPGAMVSMGSIVSDKLERRISSTGAPVIEDNNVVMRDNTNVANSAQRRAPERQQNVRVERTDPRNIDVVVNKPRIDKSKVSERNEAYQRRVETADNSSQRVNDVVNGKLQEREDAKERRDNKA